MKRMHTTVQKEIFDYLPRNHKFECLKLKLTHMCATSEIDDNMQMKALLDVFNDISTNMLKKIKKSL